MNSTVVAVRRGGTRRSFLVHVGRVAGAALLGTVGSLQRTFGAQLPENQLIVRSPRPEDFETPAHLLTSWITPTDLFYIRSHFYTPMIRETEWKLVVDGDVDRPLEMSLVELRRLPATRAVVTLECAGNGRAFFEPPVAGVQWEKGAVGTAEWQGVRLGDILARAGVRPTARYLWLDGADRGIDRAPDFIRSLPLEKALDSAKLCPGRMSFIASSCAS